jgi:BirA family biotin operon repressor/biotin-[acetyl-CoA-carboxylase] ligase
MPDKPHRIIRLQETGSTNSDAMRFACAGEPLPLWVVAETQTAGRGRAGRSWISEAGNLHASFAFQTDAHPRDAGQLSLVAGVALFDAIAAAAPELKEPLRLKWPNDVLIGSAKVAGILVETAPAPREPGFVAVMGFGVNVTAAPSGDSIEATSLADANARTDREALLEALAGSLDERLGEWNHGQGFAAIRTAWLDRAGPLGEAITVNSEAGRLGGRYRGLAENGALIAEIGGDLREISYGDVMLGQPGEARAQ